MNHPTTVKKKGTMKKQKAMLMGFSGAALSGLTKFPLPKQEGNKEFIKKVTEWYRNQNGACACLGDCPKCGHHLCFGCACFILEELSIAHQQGYAQGRKNGIKAIAEATEHGWKKGYAEGERRVAKTMQECLDLNTQDGTTDYYMFGNRMAELIDTLTKETDK